MTKYLTLYFLNIPLDTLNLYLCYIKVEDQLFID